MAPEGAPSVLYVVLDDVGFSAFELFGALIETPNIKRLADNGLKHTNSTRRRCAVEALLQLPGRHGRSDDRALAGADQEGGRPREAPETTRLVAAVRGSPMLYREIESYAASTDPWRPSPARSIWVMRSLSSCSRAGGVDGER
jgi:hypothetical protein